MMFCEVLCFPLVLLQASSLSIRTHCRVYTIIAQSDSSQHNPKRSHNQLNLYFKYQSHTKQLSIYECQSPLVLACVQEIKMYRGFREASAFQYFHIDKSNHWAKGISANGDTEKSKGIIHSLYSCTNYVPKNAGNTGDVKSDLYPK